MKTEFSFIFRMQSTTKQYTQADFVVFAGLRWMQHRLNGSQDDYPNQRSALQHDGKVTWVKGVVAKGIVTGILEEPEMYYYEARYDAGTSDQAWMAECDRNYLMRLLWGPKRQITSSVPLNSEELKSREPEVWYLWLIAGAPADIGAWWLTKLQVPDISTILAGAAKSYQAWLVSEQEKQDKAVKENRLRVKLQSLVEGARTILIPLQSQLVLLPHNEQLSWQELLKFMAELQLATMEEAGLLKAITYIESKLTPVKALPTKITNLKRLTELREKVQRALQEARNIVQQLKEQNQIKLLPSSEHKTLKEFIDHLMALEPKSLDEAKLTKELALLENKRQYLIAMQEKLKELAVKKAKRRLVSLGAQLQTLIGEASNIVKPIIAQQHQQLLPLDEQQMLQNFIAYLEALNPASLGKEALKQEIALLQDKQKYLTVLPQRVAELLAEHRAVASTLQGLLDAANSMVQPMVERNEVMLLPPDERQILQDFIAHIASLDPKLLLTPQLKQERAFLESKQQYLATIQQKIVVLAAERAHKVTELEEKIYNFNLKVKAAVLAGDYKGVIENYVFIQDCYEKISVLGIDCRSQLTEVGAKIKDAQGRLSPGTTQPVLPRVVTTDTVKIQCRVIPYAELQLEQELGSGGFGTVYSGLWRIEKIAAKRLHAGQLTENSRQAFVDEVEIMRKLDSERLVRLYGVCVAPDPYCIVMEYLPRGSLYRLLHSSEQYSWQVALQIAVDVGNGLAFLHKEKIIHRDLKSLNVLLDSQYRAKICDFGLSKVRQEVSVTSTKPVTAVGTNAWNAPELFGLRPKYSFASDIYAYGIILWEILTRETPYKDVIDSNQIQMAVKAGDREEIPDTCPIDYKEIIERCWAQAPESRPQVMQVTETLQQQLSEVMVKAWHIAAELKPAGRNEEGYHLIPAGDYDLRKVVECYQRCPVPGMDVGRVTIIFNPVLNKSFADGIELLEGRFGNPAFAAKWSHDGDATITDWRAEVVRRFEAMAAPYQDSACKHVKILPVWHGTKKAIVASIARTGYANLATTDPGFFGKGLYSSYEAEYAYRVYGPGNQGADGVLLVNWIACFSAYPVVGYKVSGYTGAIPDPGDMVQLKEKGNFGNYDAHFVPVRPRTSDPNEGSYYPCRPKERATYHEVIVFEKTQILPRYIVELQPSLPAAPLLAAAGMFGKQKEQQTTNPPAVGLKP